MHLEKYKNHKFYDEELAEKCNKRNNSQDNFQKWGMGDIFVNLARNNFINFYTLQRVVLFKKFIIIE